MLARSGDELQGMKRGIMEIADLIAITKADGDNIKPAKQSQAQFNSALHLFPPTESGWTPRVVTCSALEENGLMEIWDIVKNYEELTRQNDFWITQRIRQLLDWFRSSMEFQLLHNFKSSEGISSLMEIMETKIKNKEISPARAAAEIVNTYTGKTK
jgi:LAO/AO transport system kinase